MAETNATLANLMARPQATENMTSVADMMRQRALQPYQQNLMAAQTAGLEQQRGLTAEQIQAEKLKNQQSQIALEDQRRQQEYWANPQKFEEEVPKQAGPTSSQQAAPTLGASMSATMMPVGGSPAVAPPAPKVNFAESMLGLASDDPLARQANGMIRAGVMPQTVEANTKSLLSFRAEVLKQSADKQKVVKDGLDQAGQLLAPAAAEKDPQKQAQMLSDVLPQLEKAVSFDPQLHQEIAQLDPQHLPHILNLIGGMSHVLDYGTKQADASEKQLKIEAPTPAQVKTFTTKTLPSYQNITPQERAGFVEEARQARTRAELEKVQDRADQVEARGQLHKDSLANSLAIAGNKFGEAGLTANEKIWSDPAHGFAGALAQAKQTKDAIVAGANGNGLLTSMVPTMEVLGINHAAGISRISPQEAQAAQLPGGWAERWNAWATKSVTGKLSPELAKEGQALMDMVVDAAHQKAVTSSQLIAQGHGLKPEQTPAMDRDGKVTTLDKVSAGAKPATLPDGAGKTIDKATALKFYEAAGKDPAKAQALAEQNHWKVQ
jgi:hypothetical protein